LSPFKLKKMRTKVRNLLNAIAGTILAMLGFSSSSCEKIVDAPDEYGTPSADYKVLGTVTDTDGKPVKGIQVAIELKDKESSEVASLKDTVYTDASGIYESSRNDWPGMISATVAFNDVDGEENGGKFGSVTVTSELKQTKEGGHWYKGAYEAEIGAVLKPEE